MEDLKPCKCKSTGISIYTESCLFFSKKTIIQCLKCKRVVERRTLRQAIKVWNPKRF